LPVRAVADLARRRGLMLVVDGAQSAGSVMLNLHDLAADAYACRGHKWLLGPPGTGLLFIRKDAQPRIAPMALESGRRVYSGSAGMTNLPAVLGLGAAIDWLASQDESHFDRLLSLRDQAHRELTGAGFKSLSPPPGVFAS